MSKIFKTSEDIENLVRSQFAETGLESYGLNLEVMSLSKAKDIIKVSKASATTEFLTKSEGVITLFVYEKALERLNIESQNKIIEMALSNVSYDSEKDKINIDTQPFNQVFRMRQKYGDAFLNCLESAYYAISQIELEEKEAKEFEKSQKKNKKREDVM